MPHQRRWQPWYTVVILAGIGWVFMYANRTVLSPVLPLIGMEWELNQTQLGLISSLFFLAYTVVQIPVGMLSDRLGRRLPILVPGFLLFGFGTLLTGFVPSYAALLLLSVLTGVGQGTYYPTQFSLSTAMVPVSRRGLSAAIINSGQAVGISLGLLVSSYSALGFENGWRLPFIILAVPTLLTGLAFWRFVREPATGNRRPASVPAIDVDEGIEKPPAGLGRECRPWSRNLVLLYVLNFSSLYGFFVILTWLPYYLQTVRGYDGVAVGWISSLVAWTAVPGGLMASWASDRLVQRKTVAMIMLPFAAVSLAAIPLLRSDSALIVSLIVYGLFGKIALDPVLAALVADLADRHVYGTVFGLFNFAGMFSSVLAPYVTGFLADRSGTLDVGFYLAAGLAAVGMFAAVLLKPK